MSTVSNVPRSHHLREEKQQQRIIAAITELRVYAKPKKSLWIKIIINHDINPKIVWKMMPGLHELIKPCNGITHVWFPPLQDLRMFPLRTMRAQKLMKHRAIAQKEMMMKNRLGIFALMSNWSRSKRQLIASIFNFFSLSLSLFRLRSASGREWENKKAN